MQDEAARVFREFVDVVKALRNPVGGCPWDLAQTHESIRPYLIEECYEVIEAIDNANDDELKKELGDLLLQVVLHAQMASDRKAFNIADVVSAVKEKMIRRHPHVFGDKTVNTVNDVNNNWELIKAEEKKAAGEKESTEKLNILDGVPKALPALNRAARLGEKAQRVKFDWETAAQVFEKVKEEQQEIADEFLPVAHLSPDKIDEKAKQRIASEVGDLLFTLAQFSRHLGFSAEDCLRASCDTFVHRFTVMNEQTPGDLRDLSLQQLEEAWQNAKKSIAAGT